MSSLLCDAVGSSFFKLGKKRKLTAPPSHKEGMRPFENVTLLVYVGKRQT